MQNQALNFPLDGVEQFFSKKKGTSMRENVNLHWNFPKGTTAKAKGTMAIAVVSIKIELYIVK